MTEMLPDYAQEFALRGPAGESSPEIGSTAAARLQKM